MMKKVLFLMALVFFVGCGNSGIEKPDNLIGENKMVDIIYDLSILEAARVNNAASLQERDIEPAQFVYKKYKIDSLQFVNSDRYYASDIEKYSKIYDRVTKRLERESKNIDSLSKIKPKFKTPPLKDSIIEPRKRGKMGNDPNFSNNLK